MTSKQKGLLAILLAALLWGPSPVIAKIALREVPPFSLAFLRSFFSSLILFSIFLPRGRYFQIKKGDVKKFIAAGLLGSFFTLGFVLWGLKFTTAINSQIIFTFSPVLTAVLAYFLFKEHIKLIQFAGVFMGLFGALMIILRDFFETGSISEDSLFGNILILIAVFSWVGYILISKTLSRNYSPITITSLSFLVAFIGFFPLALWETLRQTEWIFSLSSKGIFGIVYYSIFSSVFAYLAYQTGIKLTGAFSAGLAMYLSPVITVLVAVPVLGEKITLVFIAGSALVISGTIIAARPYAKPSASSASALVL